MIKLIPIEVECHSGYKADEYPKWFCLNDKRFDIAGITDRWYQGDTNPEYPVSNYFKVETTFGEHYIIKHDLESDRWYLCQQKND
jgi:hypothetical protein